MNTCVDEGPYTPHQGCGRLYKCYLQDGSVCVCPCPGLQASVYTGFSRGNSCMEHLFLWHSLSSRHAVSTNTLFPGPFHTGPQNPHIKAH